MNSGARTPEELETLFEDAFVIRDREALAELLQARDSALIVADRGINVARRRRDGTWRYAIAVLTPGDTKPEEER